MGLKVVHEGVDFVGRDDHRRVGFDDRPVMCRIERNKLLDWHFGEHGGELDVDIRRFGHGAEVGAVGNVQQTQFGQLRWIAKDVFQRLQLGNVVLGFTRHVQAQIVGGQALGAVLADRPSDGAFAPVVGGQRQMPVAVHLIDRLQVLQRCRRRGDDVTPFILPPVLIEVEALAGGRNELPQAGCLGPRVGHRVVGAFNHG